jgi:hypothetical protein
MADSGSGRSGLGRPRISSCCGELLGWLVLGKTREYFVKCWFQVARPELLEFSIYVMTYSLGLGCRLWSSMYRAQSTGTLCCALGARGVTAASAYHNLPVLHSHDVLLRRSRTIKCQLIHLVGYACPYELAHEQHACLGATLVECWSNLPSP